MRFCARLRTWITIVLSGLKGLVYKEHLSGYIAFWGKVESCGLITSFHVLQNSKLLFIVVERPFGAGIVFQELYFPKCLAKYIGTHLLAWKHLCFLRTTQFTQNTHRIINKLQEGESQPNQPANQPTNQDLDHPNPERTLYSRLGAGIVFVSCGSEGAVNSSDI